MEKKLIALAAMLLCGVTTVLFADAFTVNVSVGSASADPTLTFGWAAIASVVPMPPFSGMFDVKDLYLANPANVATAAATVKGDESRLSTDIHATATSDSWVIVAGSNATLYFTLASGTMPTLYYACDEITKDGSKAKYGTVTAGSSLSVKANNTYTITTTAVTSDSEATSAVLTVAADPTNDYVWLTKDKETGKIENSWTGSFTTTKLTIDFASGSSSIYAKVGSTYYSLDGTGSTSTTAPTTYSWIATVGDATPAAVSNSTSNELVLTYASTTAAPKITMDAYSTSSKPVTTTVINDSTTVANVNWCIKIFGTLDFDGNGVVDFNDATFFYNFVTGGGTDGGVTVADLQNYANTSVSYDVATAAAAAYDFFVANVAELALDGTNYTSTDDLFNSATYFYNYIQAGGEEGGVTATDMALYSKNATDTTSAQTAKTAITELLQ